MAIQEKVDTLGVGNSDLDCVQTSTMGVASLSTNVAVPEKGVRPQSGLILNADDWGRDGTITRQTLDCMMQGAISSVSAMVYMAYSERAAEIARERDVDAGLHLNFTTAFTGPGASKQLVEHQRKLCRYLRSHRFAPAVYHLGLASSFEYVVKAQLEEFSRLYGIQADRVDGHHHMHLCANVILGKLLPFGTTVRRNMSFQPGEKSWTNLIYRRLVDRQLARRHRLTDFLFSLPPVDPIARVKKIFALADRFIVEVEAHAENPEEYQFLVAGGLFRSLGDMQIANRFAVRG